MIQLLLNSGESSYGFRDVGMIQLLLNSGESSYGESSYGAPNNGQERAS